MASLKDSLGKLKERWSALSIQRRIVIALGVAAVVAIAILAIGRASQPSFGLLYSNLSQDDAARIVERLRDMHVPYKLESGGSDVHVPEDSVHETRLTLASDGLPSGGGVGFEIFDEQRFGESEFSEQVKYHRALEGELSRTISHIAGVETARVHLVLPNRSLFASTETAASASVALKIKPGFRMRDDQVRGIVHLVASSVRSLDAEHVTVVDGEGRSLAGAATADEEMSSQTLGFRNELERGKERAVQELLDRTLGEGASVVRVAADVSFAREERTEEQFDPQGIAPRSFQISEERSNVGPNATTAGVPGAASNLPGGEAPTSGTGGGSGLFKRSETRNFEVSKVVRRAIEPVGRLQRLQVAVVVDGRWSGKAARRHFTPRSAGELARIKAIVESAVGVQSDRGDKVTVECVPFADSAHPGRRVDFGPADPIERFRPYLPYAAGAVGLLFLIVALPIWAAIRRRHRRTAKVSASVAALPAGPGGPAAIDAAIVNERLTEQARAVAEARSLAADLASRDPDLAARVVRGWLSEGTRQ